MRDINSFDETTREFMRLWKRIAELATQDTRLLERITYAMADIDTPGDHGYLDGLEDDDHTQYLNETRHDTTARHGSSVVDHGSIGGLSDDDHTQYLNEARHDTTVRHGSGVVDHGSIAGLADDDHSQYLNITRHDTTSRHGSSVVDHGSIGGLADDDHSQYLNTARHDTTARHGSSVVDHGGIGGLSDDDHTQYLLASGSRTGATSTAQIFNNTIQGQGNIIAAGGLYVGANSTPDTDDIHYEGNLKSVKISTVYDVFALHPLTTALTNSSWDGDSYSSVGTSSQIDMGVAFGVPAAPAFAYLLEILARDSATWGTADLYFACGPASASYYACTVRPAGGDVWAGGLYVVPCDANGDLWYRISASGTNTMDIYLRVWGYWI